jgi:hypothetical protein
MSKQPFSDQEQLVMDNIIKAHEEFMKLPRVFGSELQEWTEGVHKLQDILGLRVLRRDYPGVFSSIKKIKLY